MRHSIHTQGHDLLHLSDGELGGARALLPRQKKRLLALFKLLVLVTSYQDCKGHYRCKIIYLLIGINTSLELIGLLGSLGSLGLL